MRHTEIEDQEIIERYVRHQLAPQERQAFEEHFFACQECFEKLQATERFVEGIRDAAIRGLLVDRRSDDYVRVPSLWRAWMFPALVATSSASVVLAAIMGWTYLSQMPKLRRQLEQTSMEIIAQREATAAFQKQSATQAETNVPFVMLQATRDAQESPNDVVLSPDAKHLTLWMELPSGTSGIFSLEIVTPDGRRIQTLENLKRNTYGALVVNLPAEILQSEIYVVRLSRQEPSPATLVAEYRLRIRRP